MYIFSPKGPGASSQPVNIITQPCSPVVTVAAAGMGKCTVSTQALTIANTALLTSQQQQRFVLPHGQRSVR